MTKERREDIILRAFYSYGIQQQVNVMIEEMAELTQALCKWKRKIGRTCMEQDAKNTNEESLFDNIREEIADVQIMLDQMRLAFDLNGRIEVWEDSKLERLERRMKE